jgi:hypothetical protein
MKHSIFGVGNCQTDAIARCASSALGPKSHYVHPRKSGFDDKQLAKILRTAEIVFTQPVFAPKVRHIMSRSQERSGIVIESPRLFFPGFHPDLVTPNLAGKFSHLPMGNANSAILLAAWSAGLGPDDAITLFRDEVYEALGYYDAFEAATHRLIEECASFGIDAASLMRGWERPFFYVPLHPKIAVLHDIALTLLRNAGVSIRNSDPPDDRLATNVIWPVYPEIGQRLGVTGNYIFRPNRNSPDGKSDPMTLEEFVGRTYQSYERSPPDVSQFPRMDDSRYQSISSFVNGRTYFDVGGANWRDAEADAAVQVICDEELLDPRAD